MGNMKQVEETTNFPEKRRIDKESRIFRSLINYISQPTKDERRINKNKDQLNKTNLQNNLNVGFRKSTDEVAVSIKNFEHFEEENIQPNGSTKIARKILKNLKIHDNSTEFFYPEALFYHSRDHMDNPSKNMRSSSHEDVSKCNENFEKNEYSSKFSEHSIYEINNVFIRNDDKTSYISILEKKNNQFHTPPVATEDFPCDIVTNKDRIFTFTDEQRRFLAALDKAKKIHKRNEWESTQADVFEKAANDGQQKFWIVNDWKPVLHEEIDVEALLERDISLDYLPELGSYEEFVEGMNRTETNETNKEPTETMLDISMPTYSKFVEQLASHHPKKLRGLDCSLFLSGNIIPFS